MNPRPVPENSRKSRKAIFGDRDRRRNRRPHPRVRPLPTSSSEGFAARHKLKSASGEQTRRGPLRDIPAPEAMSRM